MKPDEHLLRELYHEQQMSLSEIADRFDVVDSTVWKWMQKHEIETRNQSDAQKNRYRNHPVPCRTRQSDGYELWHHRGDVVPVHRLQAVALFGLDAVTAGNVHHRSGIPWDNRPSNLQVMEQADHARTHQPRKFDETEAAQIRSEYAAGATMRGLADEHDVSTGLIGKVVNQKGVYSEG